MKKATMMRLLAGLCATACLSLAAGCGEAMQEDAPAEFETTQQAASGWTMDAWSDWDGEFIHLNWEANVGETYRVCWKRTSQSGRPCSHGNVQITAGGNDYWDGKQWSSISTQCGGVEYMVRVKRGWFNYNTEYVTTEDCF